MQIVFEKRFKDRVSDIADCVINRPSLLLPNFAPLNMAPGKSLLAACELSENVAQALEVVNRRVF